MRYIATITAFVLGGLMMQNTMMAQDRQDSLKVQDNEDNGYIMKVRPDVKTIFPDRMGLSPNTTLAEVLQTLPELTARGTSTLTSDYTLVVDGDAYNLNAEVYLSQTRVSEVERIDITTNGITTGVPGIMGYIIVSTRGAAEGVHGAVDVSTDTHGDVSPTASISWKRGAWSTRGSLSATWDRPHDESLSFDAESGQQVYSNTWKRPATEVAKWNLSYTTKKDIFSVDVTQLFSHQNDWTEQLTAGTELSDRTAWKRSDHHSDKHDVTASLRWNHTFNKNHKLILMTQYEYGRVPEENWTERCYKETDELPDSAKWGDVNTESWVHTISAIAGYSAKLAKELQLNAGLTYGLSLRSNDQNSMFFSQNAISGQIEATSESVNLKTRTHTSQAYAQFTYTPDKHWRLIAGGRIRNDGHHYDYPYLTDEGKNQNRSFTNWQASAMASYSPTPDHMIVAGYNHRTTMLSAQQINPTYLLQNDASRIWALKGNPELKAPAYNIFNVGYSYGHNPWQVLVEGRYFRNSNIIGMKVDSHAYLGRDNYRYSLENMKSQDAWSVNASCAWHNDWISLLGGVHFTHTSTQSYSVGEAPEKQNLLTARAMANVNCGRGWSTAFTQVYQTGLKTATTQSAGEWYSALSVSKTWKNFNASLRWENFFASRIWTHNLQNASYSWQNPHNHMLRLSLSYRF